MNCKPGDLAVIVSARKNPEYLGRIVRCISVEINFFGESGWIVEPPVVGWRGVSDWALRPIRDPGDDAQDETLQWLPVPHKETA